MERALVRWVALVGLLCACAASTPEIESGVASSPVAAWAHADARGECGDAGEDHCLAPACTEAGCALYRCEDFVVRGQVVRTRGSLPVRPPLDSQRYWGDPWILRRNAEPVLVFHWYRLEELPSQQQARRILEAWRQRPKERHHIFPQALKGYFASKNINIHEWVLLLDAKEHSRIHHGPNGGPWNADWREWIAEKGRRLPTEAHFEYASLMIQRYNLWGLPGTYWQRFELPSAPPKD